MKTKEKQEKTAAKKPTRTITSFMIRFLAKNPDAKFKDVPMEKIQEIKPDSSFNVYHFSWFKQQILKEEGRYHEKYQEVKKTLGSKKKKVTVEEEVEA